jgi:hypothetical protein
MKSIEQQRIDRLFADLLASEIKDKEQLDLWLVRAKDCISVKLGHDSIFLPLLDRPGTSSTSTPEQISPLSISKQSRRAKAVLAAAQEHAPISSEEDADLKKEAEYAIHNAAARSPWLKVAAAILLAAAGFTFTGTLRLNNFSLDLEKRIQTAMDERKKDLDSVAASKEAELKNTADGREKKLEESLGGLERQLDQKLEDAASAQIKKISGDKAPDILSVAQGIEGRVDRASRRLTPIEHTLSGLEGLSARLDEATISKLRELQSREHILPYAALGVAIVALLVAIFREQLKALMASKV